ncbi:MAG TPA: YncE family protein [Gemmatimonadaceae bacterium]|nr:YncE family protein [Gemmatimonadaceae bacterium]
MLATLIGTDSIARGSLAQQALPVRIAVGLTPAHVALGADGSRAFVTLQSDDGLAVVDLGSNALLTTIPLSSGGFNVAVAPDGKRVYATTATGDVYVVNVTTNAAITTVHVGPAANGLAFSPDGTMLYVSSRDSGMVAAISTVSDSVVRRYDVGGAPQRLAASSDGRLLYVANEANAVQVVDLATGAVQPIAFPSAAYGLALTPDDTQLYVTFPQEGVVRVLDRVSHTVLKVIDIGGIPRNIAFDALGHTAVVTNEVAVTFIQ